MRWRRSFRHHDGTATATTGCWRPTRRCARPSPLTGARRRPARRHLRRPFRRPTRSRHPALQHVICGRCGWPGCSSRCRWSVPTAAPTCASSPSSPRPHPSSRSSWRSVSHHARPQSRPPADRPPGTRRPSRRRTGTVSLSPSLDPQRGLDFLSVIRYPFKTSG